MFLRAGEEELLRRQDWCSIVRKPEFRKSAEPFGTTASFSAEAEERRRETGGQYDRAVSQKIYKKL